MSFVDPQDEWAGIVLPRFARRWTAEQRTEARLTVLHAQAEHALAREGRRRVIEHRKLVAGRQAFLRQAGVTTVAELLAKLRIDPAELSRLLATGVVVDDECRAQAVPPRDT